jgi:hypothetical protein
MTVRQDLAQELRLKEWELRYQSYRSYRGNYLTILSITVSGWVVGVAVALGDTFPDAYRPVVLAGATLILCACVVGHVIGIRAIRSLGQRVDDLEKELGVHTFRTTWPLEAGLRWSLGVVIVLTIITLGIFVWTL